MRIKVLVEKEFQTVLVSAAQQRWRTQSAKHSSIVQRERDRNDGDVQAGAPLRILGPLDSIFTRALLRSGGGGYIL